MLGAWWILLVLVTSADYLADNVAWIVARS